MTRYDSAKIMTMVVLYKLAVLSSWHSLGNAGLPYTMKCVVCDKTLRQHKTKELGCCIKIATAGQRCK